MSRFLLCKPVGERPAGFREAGFTLVEMMIALVVLGILITVGVPSFQDLVRNNRVLAQANALTGSLATARSEAVSRRRPVIVCRSNNGTACAGTWADGWIGYEDTDDDGTLDSGEEVFMSHDAPDDDMTITFSHADNQVTFNTRGNSAQRGTFTVCDERGATRARAVIVATTGRVRPAVDTDDPADEIVNDHDGNDVTCS
jgi:type IV fimbrial biogenesis protein FimT